MSKPPKKDIPNVRFDNEADAAYISFTEKIGAGEVADTVPLGHDDERVKTMINLDFDKDGKLLGVEVLDASKVLKSDFLGQIR